MNSLIERCHARREEIHQQQQTQVLPADYTAYPYHFCVQYAQDQSALVYDFERADISVLPIGKAPFDRAPADWLRKDRHRNRVDERQGTLDWRPRQWFASWGIGICTGATSGRDNAHWHDIEFTYQAICDAPETTLVCLEALAHAVKDPLVVLTKDGAIRFTCRVQDYLHPNTVSDKFYVHKDKPTLENAYVIIKGAQDYSVWDARHEIQMGSVFTPPIINSDVLFALIRFFKTLLHNPAWSVPDKRRVHTPKALDVRNTVKALDTDEKTICVSDKMRAVRDEQLSPLAIQRPDPVIAKQSPTEPVDISDILHSDADVIGVQTGLRDEPNSREIERTLASHFGGADRVCIPRTLFPSNLFVKHELSTNTIRDDIQYSHGSAVGDFVSALHNALKITENDKTDNIVARLRTVIKAFENVKVPLIAQMSQGDVAPTYYHLLKQFFDHHPRDTDAPMFFDGDALQFRLPPTVDPCTEKSMFLSPSIDASILERTFPDKQVAVYDVSTPASLSDNCVYQLRSEVHSPHSLLNYNSDWDALSLSTIGTRYAVGMFHEIRGTPEKQHIIISTNDMDEALSETLSENNAHFLRFHARHIDENRTRFDDMFEDTDVVWVLGTPYVEPKILWRHAKLLYGDMAKPLEYTVSMQPYRFKDPRIQQLSEAYSRQILIAMLAYAGVSHATGKTFVIQTALWLPGITDAIETRLFDWEDFEIAGGLEGLDAAIGQREAFEAEAAQIDDTWMPYEVMRVMGVDRQEANRILKEDYGRVSVVRTREEVLSLIQNGITHLKDIRVVLSDRTYRAVQHGIDELLDAGKIVRIERGAYDLSEKIDKMGV